MLATVLIWGLVSGLLSSLSNGEELMSEAGAALLNPLPGIFFAIVFLLVVRRVFDLRLPKWKWIVLAVISGAAYFVAVWVSIFTSEWGEALGLSPGSGWGTCGPVPCDKEIISGFFFAGMVGALILNLAIKGLTKTLVWWNVFALMVLGGFLGYLGAFTVEWDFSEDILLYPFLYIIWQVGMLLALCYLIQQNRNREKLI